MRSVNERPVVQGVLSHQKMFRQRRIAVWTIWYLPSCSPGCWAGICGCRVSWDDAERGEFVDEAAQEVAYRVAELADDWADRAVTEWGRWHWQLPDAETQAELVQQARRSALVAVLCEVLPEVPVAELFAVA